MFTAHSGLYMSLVTATSSRKPLVARRRISRRLRVGDLRRAQQGRCCSAVSRPQPFDQAHPAEPGHAADGVQRHSTLAVRSGSSSPRRFQPRGRTPRRSLKRRQLLQASFPTRSLT